MRRIGLHIIGNGVTDSLLNRLESAQPCLVFFTEPDLGTVMAVRDRLPDPSATLFVGRLIDDSLMAGRGTMTVQAALGLAERCIAKAQEVGIQVWQPANEPLSTGRDIDELREVGEFDVAFGRRLAEAGLEATTSAFGTGKPYFGPGNDDPQWMQFYLDTGAMEVCRYWNAHEYWHWYEKDRGVPWHIGRWESAWSHLPAESQQPVIISELGCEVQPGMTGWIGTIDTEDYLDLLRRYVREMPDTFAAALFALPGADARWASYDVSELLPALADGWQRDHLRVWPAHREVTDAVDEQRLRRYHRLLAKRLDAIGVTYENLIDRYPDKPDAWFDGRWSGHGSWFARRQEPHDLTHYVLHHTASRPLQSTDQIYASRLEDLGGFPYHILVYCTETASGKLFRKVRATRSPLQWGAHVAGNNQNKLGIAWVGRYDQNPPRARSLAGFQEMFLAIRDALDAWCEHEPRVVGHRQIALPGHGTACPGGAWVEPFVAIADHRGSRPADRYDTGYQAGARDALEQVIRALQDVADRYNVPMGNG